MRRDEADKETAWLNANDERAARLEFYALDQSAGLSADAWEVASRLRTGPAPEPALAADPGPQPVLAPLPREPEPAYEEVPAHDPPPVPSYEAYPDEPSTDEDHDEDRPGLLVRLVGSAVMLVAIVWVIAIVGLAIVLDSWGLASLLIYFGAAVLGLGALALGVAIRRS
ncbi:MAG TPA: hypothetical protein VIM22_08745 [Solirubrobacteraceae bacterium]